MIELTPRIKNDLSSNVSNLQYLVEIVSSEEIIYISTVKQSINIFQVQEGLTDDVVYENIHQATWVNAYQNNAGGMYIWDNQCHASGHNINMVENLIKLLVEQNTF